MAVWTLILSDGSEEEVEFDHVVEMEVDGVPSAYDFRRGGVHGETVRSIAVDELLEIRTR